MLILSGKDCLQKQFFLFWLLFSFYFCVSCHEWERVFALTVRLATKAIFLPYNIIPTVNTIHSLNDRTTCTVQKALKYSTIVLTLEGVYVRTLHIYSYVNQNSNFLVMYGSSI